MRSTLCFIAILVSLAALSQQTDPKMQTLKDDYLNKSRKQKKTAFIFLGSGVVLVATAFIIPKGESEGIVIDPFSGSSEAHENDGIKGATALTGILAMLTSIPFFIASSKNKKRAMNLSFKNETAPQRYQSRLAQKVFPALSFTVGL